MRPRPRHLRAAYGAVLLADPWLVLRRLGASPPDARIDVAARFLGGRQLVEGLLPAAARPVLLTIDAVHAASMVGFIALDPRRRRPAAATLVMTSVFAALTVAAPTHRGPERPSTDTVE